MALDDFFERMEREIASSREDKRKMSETTKTPVSDSRMQRLLAQREDDFTVAAFNAVVADQTWSDFKAKHPEYRFDDQWRVKYESMYGRRLLSDARNTDDFTLEAEMDAIRSRRAREKTETMTEQRYQDHRKDLLDAAYSGKPWSQVRRELELYPDEEKLYKRAKDELGYEVETKPDPLEQSFVDGFFF